MPLEERLGVALDQEENARVQTVGELRQLAMDAVGLRLPSAIAILQRMMHTRLTARNVAADVPESKTQTTAGRAARRRRGISKRVMCVCLPALAMAAAFRWARVVFTECVMRPLVWLLASPQGVRTKPAQSLAKNEAMLNHRNM